MTERATRGASAAPQAAAPRFGRDGDRFQRGRVRTCALPIALPYVKSEGRRRGAAVAEHDAAVSAAAWRCWRKDNERGAAGSGAARTARLRLRKVTTQPRRRHTQRERSASLRWRHTQRDRAASLCKGGGER